MDYILAESFHRANIQDRLWYCQTENDKTLLKTNEKIAFGDKCYVIATQKAYIMGSDSNWNEL